MADQIGRPASDIPGNDITGAPGSSGWSQSPAWSRLDEVVANDADFVSNNISALIRVGHTLTPTLYDPGINTGHIIRTRASHDGVGSGNVQLWAELWIDEGAGEVPRYTLVETFESSKVNLSASWTDYDWTVSAANAANIPTDRYNHLVIAVLGSANTGTGRALRVSQAYLTLPPAEPVSPFLFDEVEFSQTTEAGLTLRPTLVDAVQFSQLVPGTIDPQRLVDAGQQWIVTRSRVALKDRAVLIDFEESQGA